MFCIFGVYSTFLEAGRLPQVINTRECIHFTEYTGIENEKRHVCGCEIACICIDVQANLTLSLTTEAPLLGRSS